MVIKSIPFGLQCLLLNFAWTQICMNLKMSWHENKEFLEGEKMRKNNLVKNLSAMLMAWTLLVLPLAAFGQTRVTLPKSKYKVQDDVKLGQQASSEVERQMPILNDSEATRYVQQVGD